MTQLATERPRETRTTPVSSERTNYSKGRVGPGAGFPTTDSTDWNAQPHTPGQELTHFATWADKPIMVPPQGASAMFAKHLLGRCGARASADACWKTILKDYREHFTQVREIELRKNSIRLPQGRLFVSVTERNKFDQIQEKIPQSVQTRLQEFLEGPGRKPGVKVYYLKPLCVEIDKNLVFTTAEEINQAIARIQEEVFSEYRRRYPLHLLRQLSAGTFNAALAIPRYLIKDHLAHKRKVIENFHAKLEFERRKRALEAAQHWKKYRMTDCTFDEIIALTKPPERQAVIDYFADENSLSDFDRKILMIASAVSLPWFVGLSILAYQAAIAITTATTVVVTVDPVFVAEMPGSNGRLLKIGHFDEIDGVMHVEI